MVSNLLVTSYHKNNARRIELDLCLALNSKVFDAMCVVAEKEPQPEWFVGENLFWVQVNRHQVMGDLVRYANNTLQYLTCHQNAMLVALANTDIIFDPVSLGIMQKNLKPDEVYALARWELASQKLWKVDYAQDAWI